MFCGHIKLKELPNISKWNTSYLTNMELILYKCLIIKEIPDISKWNIFNIINMKIIFYWYKKIAKLPNISKCNKSQLHDIGAALYDCESLQLFYFLNCYDYN